MLCIILCMEKSVYSITKASNYLGIHPNTLRRWDRLGILKSIRTGERGDRKYLKEDLDSIIEKGRNQFKGPQLKDAPHVGVGVLLINNRDEVLLKERSESYGKGELALPGGRIAFGESPKVTAIKEVLEVLKINIIPKPFCTTFATKYLKIGQHPVTIGFYAYLDEDFSDNGNGWKFFDINNPPENIFAPSKDLIECFAKKKQYNF